MAATFNGKTVAFVRSVSSGTDSASILDFEDDHVHAIDTEIVSVGSNPTDFDTSVTRTSHGQYEMLTVMIWV